MKSLPYRYGTQLKNRHRVRATALALIMGSAEGQPRSALARETWRMLTPRRSR